MLLVILWVEEFFFWGDLFEEISNHLGIFEESSNTSLGEEPIGNSLNLTSLEILTTFAKGE